MILVEGDSKLERIWASRHVIRLLIVRDLKVRYSDTGLGYLWSVLEPLLMSIVYWFVFVKVLGISRGESPFILFVVSGQLPWFWFNGSVSASLRALRSEAALVRSTNLPREVWILRIVFSKGVEFVFALPVIVIFAIAYHHGINKDIVFLPLAIVLEFFLITGLSLLLAPIAVLVPDVENIVKIALRVLFYLSPILYAATALKHPAANQRKISPEIQHLFKYNPLSGIFGMLRSGLWSDELNWDFMVSSVIGTAVIFAAGVFVFNRLESTVLKEI